MVPIYDIAVNKPIYKSTKYGYLNSGGCVGFARLLKHPETPSPTNEMLARKLNMWLATYHNRKIAILHNIHIANSLVSSDSDGYYAMIIVCYIAMWLAT